MPKSESPANDSPAELPSVELYTDGGCSGNPGPGGWAFILKHPASGKVMESSGGEAMTTNNRMELTGVIRGLETLKKRSRVLLFTDSKYVGQGLSEWMPKWKANNWRRKSKSGWEEVKNEDLWRLLDELASRHDLKYT